MSDCEWKKKKITVKEGEAVRFLKKGGKVRICEDGILKYKKIADVQFTLACNGEKYVENTKHKKVTKDNLK